MLKNLSLRYWSCPLHTCLLSVLVHNFCAQTSGVLLHFVGIVPLYSPRKNNLFTVVDNAYSLIFLRGMRVCICPVLTIISTPLNLLGHEPTLPITCTLTPWRLIRLLSQCHPPPLIYVHCLLVGLDNKWQRTRLPVLPCDTIGPVLHVCSQILSCN